MEAQTTEQEISVEQALEVLHGEGYVLWKAPMASQDTEAIDMSRFKGKKVRVGIVSDTHLGSQYQQITHLRALYRYFSRRKVNVVLHAGDLVCGEGLYFGHRYELFAIGADNQIEYVVNNYPKYKGITTYLISGNHDAVFQKKAGIDVVATICRRREDMVYLGYGGADVDIGGVKFALIHPSGGVPYARSYRAQKIIEQLPGGSKPHVLIIGHLHITDILPNYRNVLSIMAGCFQSQTPYLRRKGLAPDVGGYLLEFETSDVDAPNGAVGFKIEWRPFHVPKDKDY